MINWNSKSSLLIKVDNKKLDEELYLKIRDFLVESEGIYPDIEAWWKKKVVPGLKSGERLCEVITTNDEISALSIIKFSKTSSKLCTLRVRDKYQTLGFGEKLLNRSISNMASYGSKSIHYTISEEIQFKCGQFFFPYSFALRAWKRHKYSKGKDELTFSGKTHQLINRLTSGRNFLELEYERTAVIFSIRPEYAALIENGQKRIEFRRRFNAKLVPILGFFYVTSPIRQIRFVVRIEQVIKATPNSLWTQFKDECGVPLGSFNRYFSSEEKGTALLLSEIHKLERPIDLNELTLSPLSFSPPRSHKVIRESDPIFPFIRSRI